MPIPEELKSEILECLRRSGYLLESRLVRSLSEAGFFVEPNIGVIDPRTGKTREIDILAEYFDHEPARSNINVRTHFAIEAINNSLPVVLMTPHPGSPNENFESYVKFGVTPNPAPFLQQLEIYEQKFRYDKARYSQYCGLTRKKQGDELMASHPDDLYSSLLKLAEFVDREERDFADREWYSPDPFWRLWFWQGLLVLGGELLVATETPGGELLLSEVHQADLIFNFHSGNDPTTVLINVVREQALLSYLETTVTVDQDLARQMVELRTSSAQNAT